MRLREEPPLHGLPAIVLADGCFAEPEGKVAHGLIRDGDRFAVWVVVDHTLAGRDAGEVLDGSPRGIPIVTDVAEAVRRAPDAGVAVVGHAPHGGRLTPDLRAQLMECAAAGLDLVSGLHDHLCDEPELAALAAANGATPSTSAAHRRPAICGSGTVRSTPSAPHGSRSSAPTAFSASAPPPGCSPGISGAEAFAPR